jgi:hypothetical protein
VQQNKLNFQELPYNTNVQPFSILKIFATLFNQLVFKGIWIAWKKTPTTSWFASNAWNFVYNFLVVRFASLTDDEAPTPMSNKKMHQKAKKCITQQQIMTITTSLNTHWTKNEANLKLKPTNS